MTVFELVRNFFRTYLVKERGLSANTVSSYAQAVKQLLNFAATQQALAVHQLDLATFTADLVRQFLDQVEAANSIATRNQRLSAIRTFFNYLARQHPDMVAADQGICRLVNKKTPQPVMPNLNHAEVQAFFHAVRQQPHGDLQTRDHALFQLLYNTGARASEIVNLDIVNVDLNGFPSVTLTGKGAKARVVPLWPETVEALQRYLHTRPHHVRDHQALFLNRQQRRLTRFGLRDIVRRYSQRANTNQPSLLHKRVTTHTFRHTTAFHILRATDDIVSVQAWLGHQNLNTTSRYCAIDPETKRRALSTFRPTDQSPPACLWKTPDVIAFLDHLAKSTPTHTLCEVKRPLNEDPQSQQRRNFT